MRTPRTDTIYFDEQTGYSFSPDGVGRIYFDTLAELVDQTGLDPVHGITIVPVDYFDTDGWREEN